jgi:hypothetical protein
MRRAALLLAATAFASVALTTPAGASLTCRDLGPVPGYGPVCVVECVLTTSPRLDPKDLRGSLPTLVAQCPA